MSRKTVDEVVQSGRCWEQLVSAQVIEEFSHREVVAEGLLQPPNIERDFSWLFIDQNEHEQASTPFCGQQSEATCDKRKRLFATLERLKDPNKFSYMKPETEQRLAADLRLLRVLNANNWWHRIGDAWVTGLLPVHSLIRIKSSNEHVFVLKSNESAALCWPAERLSAISRIWRKRLDIKELSWHVIFNLDDVEVLPTEYRSPLALAHEDGHARIMYIVGVECCLGSRPWISIVLLFFISRTCMLLHVVVFMGSNHFDFVCFL